MNEPERETAGTVRSTAVAHFVAHGWPQTAALMAGALERIVRDSTPTQLLIVVPDANAASDLAAQLRVLAPDLHILPARSAARATRVQQLATPHVVLAPPAVLAAMLRASALPLGGVQTVVLASADEYASDLDTLSIILSELPRTAARILITATMSPAVETLLERHFHRARRPVTDVETPAPLPANSPAIHVRLVSPLAPLEPIAELLDDLDPPSVALVAPDAPTGTALQELMLALGYPADSPLIVVTRGPVADHTHLVVFAGLPTREMLAGALGAQPARVVALVSSRERAELQRRAHGTRLLSYDSALASASARGREQALRDLLRATMAESSPVREILALEPLLAEHDGLEIAAAALRLYERATAAAVRPVSPPAREEPRPAERRAAPPDRAAAPFNRKAAPFDRKQPPRKPR